MDRYARIRSKSQKSSKFPPADDMISLILAKYKTDQPMSFSSTIYANKIIALPI